MKILVPILAIAFSVFSGARMFFAMDAPWASTFAVLVCGGGLIAIGILLRNAVASAPCRRAKLPSDPGFPREPGGAPYRGPRY